MTNRVYKFGEPHYTGGDCVVTITEEQILKYQRKRQETNIKMKDAPVEDLIDDFLITHWCHEVKDKGGK